MAEFIEFPTGKRIIDNYKCDNCKWNVGYAKLDPTRVWCDKHLCYKNKSNSCEKYNFRLE